MLSLAEQFHCHSTKAWRGGILSDKINPFLPDREIDVAQEPTTVIIQRYLDELAGGAPAEPVVRALLDRAVRRLHQLSAAHLHRQYPRLMRPALEPSVRGNAGGADRTFTQGSSRSPSRYRTAVFRDCEPAYALGVE